MKTRIHLTLTLIVFWLAAVDIGFAQQSDQVGNVQFANSCSPAVQEKLLRGVAMLHSFYYSATQKAFNDVAAEDPSCAIAAWGYASILMANPLQGVGATPDGAKQAQDAIEKGRDATPALVRARRLLEGAPRTTTSIPLWSGGW